MISKCVPNMFTITSLFLQSLYFLWNEIVFQICLISIRLTLISITMTWQLCHRSQKIKVRAQQYNDKYEWDEWKLIFVYISTWPPYRQRYGGHILYWPPFVGLVYILLEEASDPVWFPIWGFWLVQFLWFSGFLIRLKRKTFFSFFQNHREDVTSCLWAGVKE